MKPTVGFLTGVAAGLLAVAAFYVVAKPGIVRSVGARVAIELGRLDVPVIGHIPPDVVDTARVIIEQSVAENLP